MMLKSLLPHKEWSQRSRRRFSQRSQKYLIAHQAWRIKDNLLPWVVIKCRMMTTKKDILIQSKSNNKKTQAVKAVNQLAAARGNSVPTAHIEGHLIKTKEWKPSIRESWHPKPAIGTRAEIRTAACTLPTPADRGRFPEEIRRVKAPHFSRRDSKWEIHSMMEKVILAVSAKQEPSETDPAEATAVESPKKATHQAKLAAKKPSLSDPWATQAWSARKAQRKLQPSITKRSWTPSV